MIVTSQNAQQRSFVGVDFLLLSHGKESMVTKMLYKKGNKVPVHKHPNEQSGYVISGKYILILGDARHEIGPDDSYTIPPNMEHAFEIIEPGEVLDFFSPPRNEGTSINCRERPEDKADGTQEPECTQST